MRIALAEDSGLLREALVLLLKSIGAEVMCSAPAAPQLLECLAGNEPDVVITDLKMPPEYTDEGVQVAKWVKATYPSTGVLVLSQYNETAQAAQLIDVDMQGVGYLLKDNVTDAKALDSALSRVHAGEVVVDPDVVERLMRARRHASEIGRLSPQERKVLAAMAEGHTDKQIATLMSLEPCTVSDHARAIFQKLRISPGPGNKRVMAVIKWLRVDNGLRSL
jgi:DNA-binding NarL/FixJ family response regulator